MSLNKIYNINEIKEKYDVFLFDVWGVMLEHEVYDKVPGVINELIKSKDVYILTNMAKRREDVTSKLNQAGLNISKDKVYSAGESSRNYIDKIEKYVEKPVLYHFDNNIHDKLLEGYPYEVTKDFKKSNSALISIYVNSYEETLEYEEAVEFLGKSKIKTICANPDELVVFQGNNRYCAGYFAKKIEKLGGDVTYIGKPYKPIYEEILNLLSVPKERILMIGDTFETDILGAKNAGIHSALVTTGNTEKYLSENRTNTSKDLDLILKKAKSVNLMPDWIISIAD